MDKFLFYLTICTIGVLVIIGGNYFLTDDVGNFNMEKAKNLIPNIEEAIVEKKNQITGTRDINRNMTSTKDAERLDIEGPAAVENLVTKPKPITRDSVTKQYMTEMNALEDNDVTSFQKQAILKEIQDRYLSKKFYWTALVRDVDKKSRYYLMTMKIEGSVFGFNILFCEMPLNEASNMSLRHIKKEDKVTVTGDYSRSDEDPWIKNCEIVTDQ